MSSANPGTGLLCGRCCRKTGEDVSKLCACGVPLHPSCSDDVAVRECELAYGFPEPAGFCSKRCYETDLLAHQSMQQQHQPHAAAAGSTEDEDDGNARLVAQLARDAKLPKRMAHVPNEVTAVLTVKIGDAGKTSRRHLSVSTFRFLLSEGFEVFKAKVNSRTTKELLQQQQHGAGVAESYVRDDRSIYIKPGVHSKQAELVQLSEKNFEARITRSFRNFLKRKSTAASSSSDHAELFECDILTYVRKDSGRRRAGSGGSGGGGGSARHTQLSAVKSTSQLHTLMEYTEQQHAAAMDVSPSAVATAAAAAGDIAASLAPAVGGHKRRYSQMLLGDSSVGRGESPSGSSATPLLDVDTAAGYKTVRMVLNGAIVPVKVNVRDLLACFGIPAAPNVNGDDSGVGMQDL